MTIIQLTYLQQTLEEEDLKEELGLRLGDRRRLLAHIEELLAGVAESSG